MENITPCTRKWIPHCDLPMRQRAMVETMMAYYYRGHAVQYDSVLLTIQEKYCGGNLRETDFCAPEDATVDDYMYAVCSSYPWEALYNAFGYQMEGGPLNFKSFKIVHTPADNPILAYRYYEHGEKEKAKDPVPNPEERKAAAKAMFEMLQVGDIIVTDRETGHTMVYLGDFLGDGTNYLMHCAGKKFNMETAEESVEFGRGNDTGGAIRIDKAEYFFFGEKTEKSGPMWPISTHPRMVVLRPLQAMDEKEYPLSPAALTRLRFPRLSADKRASHGFFLDAEEGGEVTVTVTVRNNAPSDYMEALTITEKIPANCKLKQGSVTGGGKVSGNAIVWVKTLRKGQVAELSYTVVVTGSRGQTIELAGGTVGTIPTKDITVHIGGKHLTEKQNQALDGLREGEKLASSGGADFAEKLYEKVLGLSPKIPALSQLEKTSFFLKEVEGAAVPMLHPAETMDTMIIPKWFGGMEVRTETSRDRILTILTRQMMPGDVILSQTGATDFGMPDCIVYLGNDRFAAPGEDGTVQILDAEVLNKVFPSRLFVGLRPTLVYDDIFTEAPFEEETDEEALKAIPEGPEKEELLKKLKGEKALAEQKIRRAAKEKAAAEFKRRQDAVVETAMAYWRRGKAQQYDSVELMYAESRDAIGVSRATHYRSPEDSTLQDVGYYVCSTFTTQVYLEALGYEICQDMDHCTCKYQLDTGNKSVVYHWMEDCGESKEDAIRTIRGLLRPGDILTTRKKTAHSMLFVGDVMGDGRDYMLHSWGKKYNMNTGLDAYEEKGTITLQTADELCFTEGHKEHYTSNKIPRWSLFDDQREIIVLRPLRETTNALTPNALARLAHPGLNIDRTCSVAPYNCVSVGEPVTVSVTVENHSQTNYENLPILERIPANAKLLQTDGNASVGVIRWLVDVPAGKSVTVSYTVEVTEGESIVFVGGEAAGIRSNRIERTVAKHLTDKENADLLDLANGCEGALAGENLPDLAFVNRVYEKYLGKKIPLPSAKDLLKGILVSVLDAPGAEKRLVEQRKACKWLVPGFVGGRMLITASPEDRILEFDTDFVMPGDVLLVTADPLGDKEESTVYLYLGDGAFGYMTEGGMEVTREDILWKLFTKDLFLLLRPEME